MMKMRRPTNIFNRSSNSSKIRSRMISRRMKKMRVTTTKMTPMKTPSNLRWRARRMRSVKTTRIRCSLTSMS